MTGFRISGDFTGQLAEAIHNHGPVYAGPLANAPESRLQAEFYTHVGIWCPREAREQLEGLMSHHAFTARELRVAWAANSLRWDNDQQRLQVVAPVTELLFGWLMIGLMLAYFMFTALPYLFTHPGPSGVFALCIGAVMYLGSVGLVVRHVLWPRRVAVRVGRVLEGLGSASSNVQAKVQDGLKLVRRQ